LQLGLDDEGVNLHRMHKDLARFQLDEQTSAVARQDQLEHGVAAFVQPRCGGLGGVSELGKSLLPIKVASGRYKYCGGSYIFNSVNDLIIESADYLDDQHASRLCHRNKLNL
jgi:hypothetical protein